MKNQFDMLNDVKNDIDNIEDLNLSHEEKRKITTRVLKKTKKTNNNFKRKTAIAVTLTLALTGGLIISNENVFAYINTLGRKIESFLGNDDSRFNFYKKDILKVAEDKGIKFMLHEVMLDNEELFISASVDYSNFDKSLLKSKKKNNISIIPSSKDTPYEIFLNGKKINISNIGASYKYNENKTVDMLFSSKIDNIDLNDVYDIKIAIKEMEVQNQSKGHEFIEGNWTLDFQIDGTKVLNETKIIEINKEIELDFKNTKIPVTIENLTYSPVSIIFKYKTNPKLLPDRYEVDFKFLDENNNPINFNIGNNDYITGDFSLKYMMEKDIKTLKIMPIISKHNKFSVRNTKFKDKTIEVNLK